MAQGAELSRTFGIPYRELMQERKPEMYAELMETGKLDSHCLERQEWAFDLAESIRANMEKAEKVDDLPYPKRAGKREQLQMQAEREALNMLLGELASD